MISPNEADKKLKKYDYLSYMKILNKGKAVQHTYISLLEDSDEPIYQEMDKLTQDTVSFLENNIMTDSNLESYTWNDERFGKMDNADFALVFDLDQILKGPSLKGMKRDRSASKSGLLPRIDDEFYKKVNQDKYRTKKNKNAGEIYSKFLVLDVLHEAIYLAKERNRRGGRGFGGYYQDRGSSSYNSERILMSLYELYIEDKISQPDLFDTINKFDGSLYRDFMFILNDFSREDNDGGFRQRRGGGYDYDYYDDYVRKW